MKDQLQGYSLISIILHWAGAAALIYVFLTGESMEDASRAVRQELMGEHIFWGVVLGLPLLARVVWRFARGPAALPAQHKLLDVLAKLVKVGLLVAIAGAVLTGPMQVWAAGRDITIAGVTLPALIGADEALKETLEGLHELFVHMWIPLVLLHVLGAVKHAVIDKDGVLGTMFKPRADGR